MTAPERPGPERGPTTPPEHDHEPDERDEHDQWHPHYIEGCDACEDRAVELEDES